MKLTHSFPKIFTLALLLSAFNVTASELESALKAAMGDAPSGQFDLIQPTFELFQHRFGVQPAEVVERQNRKRVLAGRLTHGARRGGVEDVVAYRITREKGAIKEILRQINEGDWMPLSDPVMQALGDWRKGVPMPVEKQREVEEALKKAVDPTWQSAAEYLIARIAIRGC